MSSTHVVATTGQTVVTTTETVVGTITIPPENQPGSDGVYISGLVTGVAGAAATGIIIKVRQGSITGAAFNIGSGNAVPVTAGLPFAIPFAALDTQTSYPTGNTYVVTITQVAATGNATTVSSTMQSEPSTPLAG